MTTVMVDARGATWIDVATYLMDNATRITAAPQYLCWLGESFDGALERLIEDLDLSEQFEYLSDETLIDADRIVISRPVEKSRRPRRNSLFG